MFVEPILSEQGREQQQSNGGNQAIKKQNTVDGIRCLLCGFWVITEVRDEEASKRRADAHACLLRASCGGKGDAGGSNMILPFLEVGGVSDHRPE